jgi:hypothetical protein
LSQMLMGDMMPDSNILAMPLIIYYVVMTTKSRSSAAFFIHQKQPSATIHKPVSAPL